MSLPRGVKALHQRKKLHSFDIFNRLIFLWDEQPIVEDLTNHGWQAKALFQSQLFTGKLLSNRGHAMLCLRPPWEISRYCLGCTISSASHFQLDTLFHDYEIEVLDANGLFMQPSSASSFSASHSDSLPS
jgi:hypothetical protein